MTERQSTTVEIVWQGITLSVTHTKAYFGAGSEYEVDHIAVESISPEKARLPITETGYRLHFIHGSKIEPFGDAVSYVRAALEGAAQSKAWLDYVTSSKQLSLF